MRLFFFPNSQCIIIIIIINHEVFVVDATMNLNFCCVNKYTRNNSNQDIASEISIFFFIFQFLFNPNEEKFENLNKQK